MIGAIFAFIMLSLVLPFVMKWTVRILCWQKKNGLESDNCSRNHLHNHSDMQMLWRLTMTEKAHRLLFFRFKEGEFYGRKAK